MEFAQTTISIILLAAAVGIAAICCGLLLKTFLEMLACVLYCAAYLRHWMSWMLYFFRIKRERPTPLPLDGLL